MSVDHGRGGVTSQPYYTRPAEAVLGESVICDRCGATMKTYADACTAKLDDPCPGFEAIEAALATIPHTGHVR